MEPGNGSRGTGAAFRIVMGRGGRGPGEAKRLLGGLERDLELAKQDIRRHDGVPCRPDVSRREASIGARNVGHGVQACRLIDKDERDPG